LGDTISKITRAKWTGVAAQVVDHLLCKHEALSSNPSPTKKRKENIGVKASIRRREEPFHFL
jgi:hypothetical protein